MTTENEPKTDPVEQLFEMGKQRRHLPSLFAAREILHLIKLGYKQGIGTHKTIIAVVSFSLGLMNDRNGLSAFIDGLNAQTNQPLQEPAKDLPIGVPPSTDPHS